MGVGRTGKGGVHERLTVSRTGYFTVGVKVVCSLYLPLGMLILINKRLLKIKSDIINQYNIEEAHQHTLIMTFLV